MTNDFVWKRELHKQIESAGYWRQICVVESEPGLFRVFQKDSLNRMEIEGKMKHVWPNSPGALADDYDTKEAAIKHAEDYFIKSKSDGWMLSQELSVG
jgi:hypothetical protein